MTSFPAPLIVRHSITGQVPERQTGHSALVLRRRSWLNRSTLGSTDSEWELTLGVRLTSTGCRSVLLLLVVVLVVRVNPGRPIGKGVMFA